MEISPIELAKDTLGVGKRIGGYVLDRVVRLGGWADFASTLSHVPEEDGLFEPAANIQYFSTESEDIPDIVA